jgi:hypothetical protein
MNTFKCSLLSASFVALSTGWAAAAPAVVLDYLNLRYAPGYDQYIIEVIPPGWIVNTGACAHVTATPTAIRTMPITMGTVVVRLSAPTPAFTRRGETRI